MVYCKSCKENKVGSSKTYLELSYDYLVLGMGGSQ